MPLTLPSMSAAIICDGKELERYDAKQEGTSLLTAFIASEAGKQFKITFSNNLTNFDSAIYLHIDGRLVQTMHLRAGKSGEFLGPYKSERSILPYKFQELQLVDPDLEDAPAAPEMGTIELKAYRCRLRRITKSSSRFAQQDLHRGPVSERSKQAGWHHVVTGDEIPVRSSDRAILDYLDSWKGPPYASQDILSPQRAQGIIPGNDVGKQGSPVNKKRAREDGSPGPSRGRQKIKREELSGDARVQRMRALQAELDALKAAEQSGTSVKRELRSHSPIVVKQSGEVVDLTLDD
ncbi:hypothetical protein BJY52DRAFT_1243489 [Lactarius psammicola]|nr:hypothetical protein BJY52DRAFT_1243489 [Lactarius psammicola]